nr:Chain A, 60S acidic ribosomal protein P2 [synthetic construct]
EEADDDMGFGLFD